MKKPVFCFALAVTAASLCLFSVSLFASDTDERIESSAKQSYVFRTCGEDIKIQSREGLVTLTGTVSDESGKSLAQETVAGLPGVLGIDNKLEIKEVPPVHSDAWLIAKVKSALWLHRSVNAPETGVSAKDGTVTLSGKASSNAQKDLTTEYAKDVEGVKNVENEMIVSSAPVMAGKKMTDDKTADHKTIGEKIDDMGESIDDASITALVKMTLLYHRSTSALKTTVVTKEGVVTLGGNAENAAERDLATKLVSDVHGVKKVINSMTVGGLRTN